MKGKAEQVRVSEPLSSYQAPSLGILGGSTAAIAACWGQEGSRVKAWSEKGRSGLIESFGSGLR